MTEDRLALAELLAKSGDGVDRSALDPAQRRRGGAAAADGGRRGGPDRRGALQAHRRAAELPERLPRPQLRHSAGLPSAPHPETAAGVLPPALPGAAEDQREGAGGGDPRSLDRRRL